MNPDPMTRPEAVWLASQQRLLREANLKAAEAFGAALAREAWLRDVYCPANKMNEEATRTKVNEDHELLDHLSTWRNWSSEVMRISATIVAEWNIRRLGYEIINGRRRPAPADPEWRTP